MQKNYTSAYARAIPGQLEGFGSPAVRTFRNSALDVLWSNTIATPSTVDNTTSYTVTLAGGDLPATITVTVTTDGSATQSELNALLLAGIRASAMHDYVVSSIASNTITLRARKPGINYTLACPTNAATTNDLTIGSQTASASSIAVPFGRILVRVTASDALNEARLPSTNSGVSVVGVSLAPRAAVIKDRIGNDAIAAYYRNEAMDVLVRSNDTVGIWVEAESGIVASTAYSALYVDCNTTGLLGRLTLTSTNNLQLPAGFGVVEGSTLGPNGENLVLLAVNLNV